MTALMPLDTAHNTSFSASLPGLQLAVDSTSLGEAKQCARKYYYSIVLGLQPRQEQIDLVFGLLVHAGAEGYARSRAQGASHDDAVVKVTKALMRSTWDPITGRPWAGESVKNRLTLLRTLVWYLDQHQEDALQTVVLADGSPAVELKFAFDSGYRTSAGEVWVLCGWLDRLATLNDEPYIPDVKTTAHALDPKYFSRFSPDNQFSLYTLAGKIAFGFEAKGVIVDAMQVLVGGARFARMLVPRARETIEEWHRDLGWWLSQMESWARAQYWPMNDKACGMYRGCQFRGICSRKPPDRQAWLDQGFIRRVWDPLKGRTDV